MVGEDCEELGAVINHTCEKKKTEMHTPGGVGPPQGVDRADECGTDTSHPQK
jgi:hypothetical protein